MPSNNGTTSPALLHPSKAPAKHEQLLTAKLNLIASDPDQCLPSAMISSNPELRRKNKSQQSNFEGKRNHIALFPFLYSNLMPNTLTLELPDAGCESIESGPPSPTTGFPGNFSEVVPGIYRSSFPRPSNFEHLRGLGLKTIL